MQDKERDKGNKYTRERNKQEKERNTCKEYTTMERDNINKYTREKRYKRQKETIDGNIQEK